MIGIALAVVLVTVHVDTRHRVATIRPIRAIGTGVDSDPPGKIPLLYSRARVARMLASGLGTISMRLYTELSIEDWHWNSAGTFSDASMQQGYWTSSASPTGSIVDSWGYRLPHRGSTHDQGDDNDYSRIDDGDPTTYWKSNPYLTSAFTHEPDSAHPQWVVVDLGSAKDVDAVSIAWVNPYATQYQVQYWTGADAIADEGSGTWIDFPHGSVAASKPGIAQIRVADAPMQERFVRILMTASSNTCDTHGTGDIRNCVGYAIGDIGVGTLDAKGAFTDDVVRKKDKTQTVMWTSSDDPWHSETDKRTEGQDQPGIDIVSTSGVTRGLPAIYPIPLFYSTPQNAANEVKYIEARHYPIEYIEMGEEIDGQYALPEDYAALYLQFADAIHAVDPRVKIGGPVFSGFNTDLQVWSDASGNASWFTRFINYLRSHGRMRDLQFFSFEHYPFKACDDGDQLQDDLLREPELMRNTLEIFRDDGLPRNIPVLITESNFSSDGGPDPARIEGSLWMADWIATALSSGVSGINYYQYETEPYDLNKRCNRNGTYTIFITGDDYTLERPASNFYAAQMLTQQWFEFGDVPQGLYRVTTSLGNDRAAVTAYAAKLPNGAWSLLFVNKDWSARTVRIPGFGTATGFATLGPDPMKGIVRASLRAGSGYVLPPRSIDVIRLRLR